MARPGAWDGTIPHQLKAGHPAIPPSWFSAIDDGDYENQHFLVVLSFSAVLITL
jgi:hypothetical protein